MRSIIRTVYWFVIRNIWFLRPIYETKGTHTPITWSRIFFQKILGFHRGVYWQVHFTSKVDSVDKIIAGVETSPGVSNGCYIHGSGGIEIGDYTQIAPNVGIISSNHDVEDGRKKKNGKVVIGKYSWIGMNAVVLPGVVLGDFTIVAAGAIVTKSFPDGYCVIGGNPAKEIKKLDPEKCVRYRSKYEYNGYIPAHKFEEFRRKNLKG